MKSLNYREFQKINKERCDLWHADHEWTPNMFFIEFLGELGELANIVKKLNRYKTGATGNRISEQGLKAKLPGEMADVQITFDLWAQSLGIYICDILSKEHSTFLALKQKSVVGIDTDVNELLLSIAADIGTFVFNREQSELKLFLKTQLKIFNLSQLLGVDIEKATKEKFNLTSEQNGFPQRL